VFHEIIQIVLFQSCDENTVKNARCNYSQDMPCNRLQQNATHCNALQHTCTMRTQSRYALQQTATECNAMQRTATHMHDANTIKICPATDCNRMQRNATHCNTHARCEHNQDMRDEHSDPPVYKEHEHHDDIITLSYTRILGIPTISFQ